MVVEKNLQKSRKSEWFSCHPGEMAWNDPLDITYFNVFIHGAACAIC